ncbi:DUF1735 domain-containing protein [Mucilaginibacter sp.]|uniref:DUF1735 domain-containing protein n=1 Tax=Mucilaginibacter sp. TaxID=1882438 RepID=UPI00284EE6FB|nr:DUF1735 domain-containing protein [Mucilaginibacter sp.]MDR3694124.1 DUF1735 domain-containing protein [Mucilaginibacter sp.]
MKKTIFILVLAAFSLSLSSCLKDKPNTDFSGIGTVIELPYSGLQYFSLDAITDAQDTIVRKFGINIASAKPLSTATTYTLVNSQALLTAYNTAHTAIDYQAMPAGSYVLSKTSGTIPAGGRLDSVTVTIYKNMLDPAKSYMLPIALASASNGILSGNFNAHYYHFIGNDFAGTYKQDFSRFNEADSLGSFSSGASFTGASAIIQPVSPTELNAATGYAGGAYTYDITFTKTGSGASASYTNFAVSFTTSSIAGAVGSGITLTQSPVFFVNGKPGTSTLPGPYTYDQAVKLFHFQYQAHTSADRYLLDRFYK